MSGLSDYLNSLNRDGWSTRRIAKEAERHGHDLSNATVSRYLNGNHPPTPSDETLAAFAAAFSVDPNRLRRAAGRPGAGEPFELGVDASRLTGPQREVVRTTVRLFVEQNDALAGRSERDGSTSRPHLSVAGGTLSPAEREELYRRAEQVDLDTEPYAAARPKDTSDDDESV